MSLRSRLQKAEERVSTQDPAVMLIILSDTEAYAAGIPTTIEAWEAEHGERARRDYEAGRIPYTCIDFRPRPATR